MFSSITCQPEIQVFLASFPTLPIDGCAIKSNFSHFYRQRLPRYSAADTGRKAPGASACGAIPLKLVANTRADGVFAPIVESEQAPVIGEGRKAAGQLHAGPGANPDVIPVWIVGQHAERLPL